RALATLQSTVEQWQQDGGGFRMGGGEALPRRLVVPYCPGKIRAVVMALPQAPGKDDLFADRDAVRFTKQVLLDQFDVQAGNISLLADRDLKPILSQYGAEALEARCRRATRAELEQVLDELNRNAGPDDFLIFHFIGHGAKDAQGRLLLQLEDGPWPAEEFLARLYLMPSALKLCVIDACSSAALSWVGVADQARTLAARLMHQEPARPLYPPILLTAASGDEASLHLEREETGVFQQALREVFLEAATFSAAPRAWTSPADIEQRVSSRVARLLERHGRQMTPRVWLWSDGMKWLPLFAAADGPPPFGKLTLVGPGLAEARIEMDGRPVNPGFTLLQPPVEQFPLEPYWTCRVSDRQGEEERSIILGVPLGSHQYRLLVTTRDGRTHSSSFRLTSFMAEQTVALDAAAAGPPPVGKPAIRITKISQREGIIAGKVYGVTGTEKVRVLCMLQTDVLYPHPWTPWRRSLVEVTPEGAWTVQHIPRGFEVKLAAALLPENAEIPNLSMQGYLSTLADIRAVALAVEEIDYRPEYSVALTATPSVQTPAPATERPVGSTAEPMPAAPEPKD
ncbi:MAG: caspase family protein, partial [Planctomycetota bacterium]